MTTDTVTGGQVPRSRSRPVPGRIARLLSREGTLVVIAGLAISAIFNWPVVLHPKSTIIGGIGDPLLQAWQMAWQHHFIVAGGDFWTANMFYPATDNFAFSDSLLGYLPLSLFGNGQYAAVLRYDIAFVLTFALAFIGCYLLVRQLGGNWQAAALAGVVFAWTPWRFSHSSHLNVLSTGGIALAFFALARGHGYSFRCGLRPELARPWWAFAGWLIAAWQVTIGFAIGIPFIYVMAPVGLVIVVVNVVKRRQLGAQLTLANGVGLVVFLGATFLMAIPYLRVVARYKFTRTWHEVQVFSPPPPSLLTAPDETWLWSGSFFNLWNSALFDKAWASETGAGEKLLFPGLVVILFALVGLVVSAWPLRIRIGLAVATVIVTIFALGSSFFGGDFTYYLVWKYLPGWNALRTPGRLILWAILLLALLAAGAVTKLAAVLAERDRTPASPGRNRKRLVAFVLVLPALGALLEGVPTQPHVTIPGMPPDLRQVFAQTREPMLILPIDTFSEYTYLLWSTEGFPQIANGFNGNFPPQYLELVDTSKSFPDAHSVAVLDKYDIHKVVVLKVAAASGPYKEALRRPLDGLPVIKTESSDLVVFTVR